MDEFRRRSSTGRKNRAANTRPIGYNGDEAHPPRHRRHAPREFSMSDHTTPTPEPPADPNRDPEDDPFASPPGHHDNPQRPDGPPSKDPV
ncbi:hypothetical protein A8D91_26160 [Burkholderia cenocepacia]|uniref:Uncharacterized protein n=1 Tax=Burkholderia cenocepacia TaxID=95486 RepID=A0A1V2VY85_9BURK|nr:hypothetical protein [Burkholderia cenocepacia]ONJ03100.1 hypothetical protein A8D83_34095 [Burkholderia cenocepacia]ONJ22827.1 hypothetical protein A8D90_28960 [Burkholderia cenocepacia]ONP37079.1 hypothetical protein A8D86_23910 [Burkholderia cenocepacia]ONP37828.1 hypothetical protein A8D85_18530 [Burkholderia cenocepacia]ONP50815.1 hypothetical protein A8D87_13075 [Burkholderia cenocepacia]